MTESPRFHGCVAYTPATPIQTPWQVGDMGLMREHFNQLAELGVSHLLITPSWAHLQPQANRIASRPMRFIEHCLDLAHQAHLSVIVSLLAIEHEGALTLPAWHNHADVVGWLQGRTTQPIHVVGAPALIDGHWRSLQMANPFTTAALVDAQHLLIRTVMGYFASHPACSWWLLAAGWSRLPGTTLPAHAAHWWQQLRETALLAAPQAPVMSLIDGPTLTRQHALDMAVLATHSDMLVVNAAMPELTTRAQRRLSAPALFSHELVHALSNKPVMVALPPLLMAPAQASWQRVAWHQQALDVPCVPGEDAGLYLEHLLQQLHASGCAGVMWPAAFPAPAYHHPPTATWAAPQWPLARHPGLLTPVGTAWAHWFGQMRRVTTHTASIDSERYWHRPHAEFLRLWHAYA